MQTRFKQIKKLNTALNVGKRSFLFFIFLFNALLFVQNSYAQNQQQWTKIAEKNTNFYEVKAAFLRDNAEKLKQYQQDLDDLSAGKISELPKGKYSGLKQFMRLAEWYEPRVAESNGDMRVIGKGEYEARLKAQKQTQLRAVSWTLLGPINQTSNMAGNGRVNNLRVDPTNPNILYACTPASQLFKSTNGGTSWTSISDGILSTGVTDVAIDPTAPNTLYALTGDADRAIYHPASIGMYKSTNGGATWNTTGLSYTQGNGVSLTSILIHPTSPNILLVSGTNGIRRSTDGGGTFTQTSTVSVRDLAFNPSNPSTVFAGSKTGGVFLRSYDNGITWTQITNGLPTTDVVRFAIAVSSIDTNYVYALATNGSNAMKGFYRSTDGGSTFTLMATTPNIPSSQGWYNLCIAADPSALNTVYAGGVQGYKSTDGGATWATSSSGVHVDFHDLTFAGTTLYAATDGGVYKSTNGASTWSNISSNLSIAQLYGIGLSASNANLMIGGHQDNGTNLTTDLTNWRQVSGGDGMISFIDRTNDNIMYCTYQNGVLRKSTNGGSSFSTIYTVPGGNWVTPFIQDPQVATTLYTGGSQVYKSTNAGTSWTAISSLTSASVRWIDVDRNNSQVIYALTSNNLYKTTNGGTSWSTASSGLPTSGLLHVHIDVNNNNNVYVSRSSYSGSSVYYSNDGGATWSLFASGLPNVPANTIVTQIGLPGELYCGTDIGVYYRNSSSSSWQSCNAGMPTVPVRDLEIFYNTGKIRAATFGRSIWESPLVNTGSTCAAPSTPSVSSITTTGATVSWGIVSGAVSYTLEYKTSAASTWTSVTGITSTSYNLTGLTASTAYNVRVTTVCSTGSSTPSTQANFTTLSAPTCNAPSTPSVSSITSSGATVSWTAVSGAVSYTLEYKTSTASTWTSVTGITGTSYNLTGLTASTAYNVRVTTVCSTGSSTPSTQANFTTSGTTTTCSRPGRPNISNITSTTAFVTWGATTGVVSYTLEYKINTVSTWTPVAGITANSYTLTGLTPKETYNTRVTAFCNGSKSTVSQQRNFTTLASGNVSSDAFNGSEETVLTDKLIFNVSPNPADNIVNLEIMAPVEGTYTIGFYNIVGQMVYAQKYGLSEGDNQVSLPVSHLAKGIFSVRVSSDKESVVQKLIIK